MDYELIGPKRDGIVDQFWTIGWKLRYKDFLFGQAYQLTDTDNIEDMIEYRLKPDLFWFYSRMIGPLGWWHEGVMRLKGFYRKKIRFPIWLWLLRRGLIRVED